ncbi:DUF4181 domain-containing protein [Planococcus liqunii]|uniref:DUF4181 domain-containing protein n=1 Tax=Planococcus liqunii TaxID=3058394 RepID=UPI002604FD14|nr:DUF4181 domain-containing protein [Planococcus sp. N056]WKA51833.1 DUF4181 domain-containing protein [Planococcus sp. N056]
MGKLLLSIAVLFIVIFLVKVLLRKIFHIEKRKKEFFSYSHVNSLHRKVDWAIRIGSMIVYLIFFYKLIYEDYSLNLMLGIMLTLFVLQMAVQAFFEWRYSEHPKEAILTASEMAILALAIGAVIWFDLMKFLIDAPVS